MSEMSNITFLLPLWDRSYYTKTWLKHNILPECNYYIADGGMGNENEDLFKNVSLANVTYVRYPKDITSHDFIKKMHHAANQIKTKYVMVVDNDDFINFDGIIQCINLLEKDSRAVCAGGVMYGIRQSNSTSEGFRYDLPLKATDNYTLHNLSRFKAIVQLFKNYRYLWYSIFRSEDHKKIWEDIKTCNISNLFLVEILHTELAFCYGKYAHVKRNHYIRLKNPITSCAAALSLNDKPHTQKIYNDNDYTNELIHMSKYVANKLNVALEELLAETMCYYNMQNNKKSSAGVFKIYALLLRLHEIVLRKLHVSLSIRQCISYINTICRMRGALRM